MNEVQKSSLQQLEAEINLLKKQTAKQIIEIGRKELGEKATLKQIINLVSPVFGLTKKECYEVFGYRVVK